MAGIEAIYRPVNDTDWIEPLRQFAAATYGDRVEIEEKPSAVHLVRQTELAAQRMGSADVGLVVARLRADMPGSFNADLPVDTKGVTYWKASRANRLPLIIKFADDPLEPERDAVFEHLGRYNIHPRAQNMPYMAIIGSILISAFCGEEKVRARLALSDHVPTQIKLGRGAIPYKNNP